MPLFSERSGVKPRKAIQLKSMDIDLKNKLWSALFQTYLSQIEEYAWSDTAQLTGRRGHVISASDCQFLTDLWIELYKDRVDTLNLRDWNTVRSHIWDRYSVADWFDVFDLLEFFATRFPEEKKNSTFKIRCNKYLASESSAYQFVGDEIAEITSEIEIKEIDDALQFSPRQVEIHLARALALFADRKNPDYRNSMKESISAVESACNLISEKKNENLTQALKEMEKKGVSIHGALKAAFNSIYGYTSDANGIRHGLWEQDNIEIEDARFMLIACSAFVNYLRIKAEKTRNLIQDESIRPRQTDGPKLLNEDIA